MGVDDLIKLCKSLAKSKGFYERLLEQLDNMSEEELADIDCTMKENNLKDDLDIILWLES